LKSYLETLFRNPRLVLAPILVLPVLAFVALKVLPTSYTTSATLWVDVATDESSASSAKVSTPSQDEAKAFQDWLETVAFRKQMITDAGLAPQVEALQWPAPTAPGTWFADIGLSPVAKKLDGTTPATADEARKRATDYVLKTIHVTAKGDNLVMVTYSGPDKANGQKLVEAATSNYLREKASAAQRKVDESNRVHDPIIADLEQEVEDARNAYSSFSASLPSIPTAAQQQQLTDLETAYKDATSRLEELKLNRDSSTLSTLTDWTNKSTNVSLIDAPDSPQNTQGLMALAKMAILAGMLGSFLGGVLVVLRTWLDRELRIPEDIEARLGRPVIAVLPLMAEPKLGAGRGH
jgi:uncharacterized protein involved in exopolysaccharide biosynthesis